MLDQHSSQKQIPGALKSICENPNVRTSKEKSQSSHKGISDKENWTGNNIF